MASPVIKTTVNVIEKYQAEVNANTKNVDAQTGLGWAYYGQRQFIEAIRVFEAALALDSNHLEARYGLALTYKANGARTQAITEFEKAAALADKLEDSVRQLMIRRQIRGHINFINSGDWNLGKSVARA